MSELDGGVAIEESETKKRRQVSSEAHSSQEDNEQRAEEKHGKKSDGKIDDELRSMMTLYYEKFFPFEVICAWLSYGKEEGFTNREISFQLEDSIIQRFRSFLSVAEFKAWTVKNLPQKIDFGAVYSTAPNLKHTAPDTFRALEKELVFDVDMDDYNDIRKCCSQSTTGNICTKCWVFMTAAVKSINYILKNHFGFKQILFVFSGRRGVHCWVSDKKARLMNQEQRKKMMIYLNLVVSSSAGSKSDSTPTYQHAFGKEVHPGFADLIREILVPLFTDHVVSEQKVFDLPEDWNKVLYFVDDEKISDEINSEWKQSTLDGDGKWKQFKKTIEKHSKKQRISCETIISEIVVRYTYPRFDMKVSEQPEHLLKSPFCVHPATGKICIPIDPDRCENFNPDEVVTLSQLVNEVTEYIQSNPGSNPSDPLLNRDLINKTEFSVFKHYDYFRKYVASLHPTEKTKTESSLEF